MGRTEKLSADAVDIDKAMQLLYDFFELNDVPMIKDFFAINQISDPNALAACFNIVCVILQKYGLPPAEILNLARHFENCVAHVGAIITSTFTPETPRDQ